MNEQENRSTATEFENKMNASAETVGDTSLEAAKEVAENISDTAQKAPKNIGKEILSWVFTIAIAVAAALVIRAFLFEPVRVDGSSMCDTLQNGEVMFVTKPEYLFGNPQEGDVVICKYPDRGNTKFVKRIIGVPGDTIEIKNNIVYRNGEQLEESYITPSRNNNGPDISITLGEKEYFVCGDNRANSHDCRNMTSWGEPTCITRDMIVGHVQFVVFPFNKIRKVQ